MWLILIIIFLTLCKALQKAKRSWECADGTWMESQPHGLALNLKKLAYPFEIKLSCLSDKDKTTTLCSLLEYMETETISPDGTVAGTK